MTAEPALLAATAAAPDDDTPRLVYADWLDDRGDAARAEFIRLQCELARGGPDDPAAAERADELENAHRTRWLSGVPTGPGLRWEFRRGFPERLEAVTQLLLNQYKKVAPLALLRDLCLTSYSGEAARVFVSRRWPAGLVELEIVVNVVGWRGPDEVRAAVRVLASCPQLSQLRVLRMGDAELPPGAVAALADSRHLDTLERLFVSDDPDQSRYAPLRARFSDRLVGEGA